MTKDQVIEQMREALKTAKRDLMHQRMFGVDRLSDWRNTASSVEGDIEEALAAAKAADPETQYSIDTDPQGIRARVVSAVVGALAYGARNTNKPPEGHWLNEVWDIARAEAKAVEPQPERQWQELTPEKMQEMVGSYFAEWWAQEAAHGMLKDYSTALREKNASTERNPLTWQPIETAPKSGEFLILVWSGDWNNPKQKRTVFHAHGYPSGPSWAMQGNYRTEEGGAYKVEGWMPLPEAPALTNGGQQ